MYEKMYWIDERLSDEIKNGAAFEARARVALHLVETYGAIAGKRGEGEDVSGRPIFELQSPAELVERCFSISELFFDECEKRGLIRSPMTPEARIEVEIELDKLRYGRKRKPEEQW